MEIQRVMVTGAGGYIGTALTEALLNKGYKVVALDRFLFGPTLDHLKTPKLKIVRGDIRWVSAPVFRGIDAVCDLAAISNDPSGALDPAKTMSINAAGRARVARLAKDAGAQIYVLASSCSVYGNQADWVTEASPVKPLTTYARANLEAERAALALSDPSFCVTALRQATVYGLSRRMRFDLVINAMTLSLVHKGEISVQRDGSQWRPLIHVQDTVRAFLLVLESGRDRTNGHVFNVGSDEQNVQMLPLAERVASALGFTCDVRWYGEEDRRSYRVRFDKIRSVLGYQPQFQPEDGVREVAAALREDRVRPDLRTHTVEWYRKLMCEGVL